jgi:hypothetical protein
MWWFVLISVGLAASMTLQVGAKPANRNTRIQGEGLSVNNLSNKRQVRLLEVERNTGYRLGNRGSFRDGDRFFVAPSRLERGPPRTLAKSLKRFHPGRKRGQSVSWTIKTTLVQRLKFLGLYLHPVIVPDRLVANFTSFVLCDLYVSNNIWNVGYWAVFVVYSGSV